MGIGTTNNIFIYVGACGAAIFLLSLIAAYLFRYITLDRVVY